MHYSVQVLCALGLIFAQLCQPGNARAEELPVEPLGEWYAVGHRMGHEARPSYRLLSVPGKELHSRLTEVLYALGVNPETQLKNSELKHLQEGWDDGIAGRSAAMTYPPEQSRSLMPVPLRGFHTFHGKDKSAEGPGEGQSLAEKAAEWKKAVVKVLTTLSDGTAHGTGFFIGPGLLVTNHHVIDGHIKLTVQLEADQTLHPATVVASLKVPDVALLQITQQDNVSLPLGNSDTCKELQDVIMIGYPQFNFLTATSVKGSISSTHVALKEGFEDVIQLDIRSNGGNSGGPIIATNGSVIGILTFGLGKIDAKLSQFTFAQKINAVLPFLEKNAADKFQLREE